MNAGPQRVEFTAFPKQNDKFLTNARQITGAMGTPGIDQVIKEYQFAIVYLILLRRFVSPATGPPIFP